MIEKKIIEGYTDLYLSDYVLTEIIHSLQNKIRFKDTIKCYEKIVEKCNIVKVIYPETVKKAIYFKLSAFCNRNTGKPKFGIVDATSLIIMEESSLNYIISFDKHFKDIPLIHTIYEVNHLNGLY